MLSLLLKPRWIAFTLFALVVTVTCARLGFWQLDRLEGRRYYNALFREGMKRAPEPIESLLASPGPNPIDYRRATADGRFDIENEVILYGRSLRDQPGNHILTPLVLADGRAVLVDRGWVPFELDTPPVAAAAPPAGRVQVEGFLSPDESEGSKPPGTGAPRITTFTRVDLRTIGAQLPYELLPWYLTSQTQSPRQPSDLPRAVAPPELTEGPHLGYAFQWFAFATIAVVGYVILIRRELLNRRHDALPDRSEPSRPTEAKE